ncbi:MAG TPA: ATP-binding cassette domain-containing protein [Candidatus Bathyarchaeia archaeon]|nr:ATP-binding cassette domain-containing protein [Candidatus Bathyarchaeia archaeon]
MVETKILKALELTKIFPHPSKEETNIPLFAGTSFEMTSEKPNFIVGVSGSGKTTLFRIISSLEPINAGELLLDDIAIHRLKGKKKADYLQRLGFMDQFPVKYLSMLLTVEQNLDYTLTLYSSLPKEERTKKIAEIASLLDFSNILQRKTVHLSGGELHRVGLACSIIYEPILLLCDEPAAQLDVNNKNKVVETIHKLNDSFNTMIIIATHDHSIIGKNPMFKIDNRRITKCQ